VTRPPDLEERLRSRGRGEEGRATWKERRGRGVGEWAGREVGLVDQFLGWLCQERKIRLSANTTLYREPTHGKDNFNQINY
jgi:hypothetical protein